LYKNCGWWKNFDCIFGFSVKSYVRNTINLSCAKILLTSVTCYVQLKVLENCVFNTQIYVRFYQNCVKFEVQVTNFHSFSWIQLMPCFQNTVFWLEWKTMDIVQKLSISILLSKANKMQHFIIFFITVCALHVSGGFSAHHQELKNCTHSIWYVPGLLAATASGSSKQSWHISDVVCTVLELLMMGGETAQNM